MEPDRYFKQLLVHIFGFSRGAEMRYRIVAALIERPRNANQISKLLGVDYKSVQHHINVLLENKLIQTPVQDAYGATYFLTAMMEQYFPYVQEIWNKYGKSHKR